MRITMIRSFVVAFALLGSLAVAAVAVEPKLPKNIVRSFDKASEPHQDLKAKAPGWFHWEVVRVSPDKKYVVRLTVTDGEYANVVVYRRIGKKNVWAKRYAVSRNFEDVMSCVWAPKHAHRLIVSAGYENEAGIGIALWDGPSKMRVLKRLKIKFNVTDNYEIHGTSADGHILYYAHFSSDVANPKNDYDIMQTLILPK